MRPANNEERGESPQRKRAKRIAIAIFILSAILCIGSLILIYAYDAGLAGFVVLMVSLAVWLLGLGFGVMVQLSD